MRFFREKRGEKINKTINNVYETYPSEEEIKIAVRACCGRCCSACETPVEYAWRKRKTDLADILALAMERELTEREREVIKDSYFNEMSAREIADKFGFSRAAAGAVKKRAENKLKKALYYLKIYLADFEQASEDDISIDAQAAILAARQSKEKCAGKKIMNLRYSKGLTLPAASRMTGISEERTAELESGSLPDAAEIKQICLAYGISYEELLD